MLMNMQIDAINKHTSKHVFKIEQTMPFVDNGNACINTNISYLLN